VTLAERRGQADHLEQPGIAAEQGGTLAGAQGVLRERTERIDGAAHAKLVVGVRALEQGDDDAPGHPVPRQSGPPGSVITARAAG
jgi:hypothetical protein